MIPQNFADAFERVKELVSIFSQNEERYLSPGYSEAQARLDFIDKFWIALGWDVAHENQTDPYKQEVKVERGVATNEYSKRYHLTRTNRLILFPYDKENMSAAQLIPEAVFKTRYPRTWSYLAENKSYLENREKGKMRGRQWYAYGRSQALDVMALPKIFTPDIAPRSAFSVDATGEVFFTGGVSGGYGVLPLPEHSREYLLGLLNSRLLEWIIHQTATQFRGGWYSYESRFIRGLPIRTIDSSNPGEKARHDRMVQLVTQMLDAKQQLAAAQMERDKNFYESKCATLDRQIDNLVYELYDLTPEEIAIVEEPSK